MDNCVFCQIVAGKIPAEKRFEDDEFLAFDSIDKKSPVHIIVIPKRHILGINEATMDDIEILGKLQLIISRIAAEQDIDTGFKVMLNAGHHQEVPHIHYHLLGGNQEGGDN